MHTRKRINSYGAVLRGGSCRIFQTLSRLECTSQGFGWMVNQESAWSHCFYSSSHQTFMRAPCVSATVLFITATQDLACHYGSHQPRMAIDIQFLVTLPLFRMLCICMRLMSTLWNRKNAKEKISPSLRSGPFLLPWVVKSLLPLRLVLPRVWSTVFTDPVCVDGLDYGS